ncbi:hypothetical protein EG329_006076 [Mollisiaceae sp. DMI_Dod_QoI]|nr:hypothetical protein EG329_006076 [Helotiales sp. DMI_Dod_QoI]
MEKASDQILGLSTLYPLEKPIVPLLDIVLVHGINGHYINTWKAADCTIWPVELLSEQLPEIRVMSYGYRGTYNDTISVATSFDHGQSLLSLLIDKRKAAHEEVRPIIFVGHSLGGIIIKQMLLIANANSDSRAQNVILSTYGVVRILVIFFSTPHNGINSDKWGQFVQIIIKNTKPDELKDTPLPPKIITAILDHSDELVQISQKFRFLKNMKYASFYEALKTPKLGAVLVPKGSATMNYVNEDIRMLPQHHFDTCKFRRGDENFNQVLSVVKSIQDDSPKAKYVGEIGRRVLSSLRIDELRTNPIVVKHTKNTCDWIAQKAEFKQWQDPKSKKDNLWISGPLGCGKTYLAEHIANVETQLEHLVAKCFLDEISEKQRTSHTILLVLLHEVLRLCPLLINKFMVKLYDERKTQNDIWDTKILVGLWPKVMLEAMTTPLTLIVDGLDQCGDDMEEFFEIFTKCQKSVREPGMFKLLIVSRDGLKFLGPSFITYRITELDTRKDIKATVQERLASTVKRRRYSQKLTDKMYTKIPEGSKGMYLWARIMADEVKLATLSEGQLEADLNKLPKGLMELYDKILGRIGESINQKDMVRFVLFWTVFRDKILKTEELRVGIAMSALTAVRGTLDVSEEQIKKFLPEGSIQNTMARLCGHLVKFSAKKINLVHESLKRFLITPTEEILRKHSEIRYQREFFFPEVDSHKVIFDFCVAYLTLRSFQASGKPYDSKAPGPLEWDKKVGDRIGQHNFVRYAALSWLVHAKLSGEPFSVNENQHQDQRVLLDLQQQPAICWTEVWWYYRKWKPMGQGYPGNHLRFDQSWNIETKSVTSSILSTRGDSQDRPPQRIAPPTPRRDIWAPDHLSPGAEAQTEDTPKTRKGARPNVPRPARSSDPPDRKTRKSSTPTQQSHLTPGSTDGKHIPTSSSDRLPTTKPSPYANAKIRGVTARHNHEPHAATSETFPGPLKEGGYSWNLENTPALHRITETRAHASEQPSLVADKAPPNSGTSRQRDTAQQNPHAIPGKQTGNFATAPGTDETDEMTSGIPVASVSINAQSRGNTEIRGNIGPRNGLGRNVGRNAHQPKVKDSGQSGIMQGPTTTPRSLPMSQTQDKHKRGSGSANISATTALDINQTTIPNHQDLSKGNSVRSAAQETQGSRNRDELAPPVSDTGIENPSIQAPKDDLQYGSTSAIHSSTFESIQGREERENSTTDTSSTIHPDSRSMPQFETVGSHKNGPAKVVLGEPHLSPILECRPSSPVHETGVERDTTREKSLATANEQAQAPISPKPTSPSQTRPKNDRTPDPEDLGVTTTSSERAQGNGIESDLSIAPAPPPSKTKRSLYLHNESEGRQTHSSTSPILVTAIPAPDKESHEVQGEPTLIKTHINTASFSERRRKQPTSAVEEGTKLDDLRLAGKQYIDDEGRSRHRKNETEHSPSLKESTETVRKVLSPTPVSFQATSFLNKEDEHYEVAGIPGALGTKRGDKRTRTTEAPSSAPLDSYDTCNTLQDCTTRDVGSSANIDGGGYRSYSQGTFHLPKKADANPRTESKSREEENPLLEFAAKVDVASIDLEAIHVNASSPRDRGERSGLPDLVSINQHAGHGNPGSFFDNRGKDRLPIFDTNDDKLKVDWGGSESNGVSSTSSIAPNSTPSNSGVDSISKLASPSSQSTHDDVTKIDQEEHRDASPSGKSLSLGESTHARAATQLAGHHSSSSGSVPKVGTASTTRPSSVSQDSRDKFHGYMLKIPGTSSPSSSNPSQDIGDNSGSRNSDGCMVDQVKKENTVKKSGQDATDRDEDNEDGQEETGQDVKSLVPSYRDLILSGTSDLSLGLPSIKKAQQKRNPEAPTLSSPGTGRPLNDKYPMRTDPKSSAPNNFDTLPLENDAEPRPSHRNVSTTSGYDEAPSSSSEPPRKRGPKPPPGPKLSPGPEVRPSTLIDRNKEEHPEESDEKSESNWCDCCLDIFPFLRKKSQD